MRLPKSASLIRRFMLIVTLVSLLLAALDLFNILPGIAAKLTPILLAFIILFLLYTNQQQRRSHQILRNVSRKPGKQSPQSKSAPKPNKKRQPIDERAKQMKEIADFRTANQI